MAAVSEFQALPSNERSPSVSRPTWTTRCASAGASSGICSGGAAWEQPAAATQSKPAMPTVICLIAAESVAGWAVTEKPACAPAIEVSVCPGLTQNDNLKWGDSQISLVFFQRNEKEDSTVDVPVSLRDLTRPTGGPGSPKHFEWRPKCGRARVRAVFDAPGHNRYLDAWSGECG